jgi:cytochrome c5
MCHTPLNILGAPKNNHYLTGGFIQGYWAPNINKLGLESATEAEVAAVFVNNELLHNAGPVAGPMAEVDHNSLKYLTEDDRLAIAVYLKTVVSKEWVGVEGAEATPNLSRGKQVYLSSCILCHQNGAMSAPLLGDGPNWYLRLKTSGVNNLYRHVINGFNSMPIKGACVSCSDNDIIASVDYILKQSLSRSQQLDLAADKVKNFPANGRDIYNENCSICHNDRKSGAPVIGDKKAWEPLIAKNIDVLVENTIKGQHHPKNGGCKNCSTGEILAAIKYIVNQSKTTGNYSLW